jgi:hypothetical protein
MKEPEAEQKLRIRFRLRATAAFLSCLAMLATAVLLLNQGLEEMRPSAPSAQEMLSAQSWAWGDSRMGALAKASRALARKSAILNQLLDHKGSHESRGATLRGEREAGSQQTSDLSVLIHEGATIQQLNRALESKARLLAKFRRGEGLDRATGYHYQELSEIATDGDSSDTPPDRTTATTAATVATHSDETAAGVCVSVLECERARV